MRCWEAGPLFRLFRPFLPCFFKWEHVSSTPRAKSSKRLRGLATETVRETARDNIWSTKGRLYKVEETKRRRGEGGGGFRSGGTNTGPAPGSYGRVGAGRARDGSVMTPEPAPDSSPHLRLAAHLRTRVEPGQAGTAIGSGPRGR